MRNGLQLFLQMGFLCQRSAIQSDESYDHARNSSLAVVNTDNSCAVYQVCDQSCTVHHPTHTSGPNVVQGESGLSGPSGSSFLPTTSDIWMFPGQSDGLDDESVVSSVRQRKEKELQVAGPLQFISAFLLHLFAV